jgi:hypothetical protein
MESSPSSAQDAESGALLPIVRAIGMSTRPSMIRSNTGLNLIFPFSTVIFKPSIKGILFLKIFGRKSSLAVKKKD